MLARAPYQVPSGEDKERSGEVKSGLHTGGTLHTVSGEIGTPVLEDDRGGESRIACPYGTKRTTSEDLETEVFKQGKKPSPGGPASEGILAAKRPQGGQPSTERK